MLKHLELRNFKCFEKLNLDLKNVNVFTGLNGMGKSTVIQSLLVLYQSLNNNSNTTGLKFNADLISLGNSQDVFYDKAEDNSININITNTEGKCFEYKCEYKQDVDFLPFVTKNDEEKINSDSSFTFLSAYRIKPQEQYKIANEEDVSKKQFGTSGEFALQYLSVYGDKDIENKNVIITDEKGSSLLNQTRLWMNRVSPGVNPKVKVMKDIRSSELSYDFIEGNDKSNTYKSVNVGFGITYVLPVVIALLASKPGDIVIIENPETHLHPAGQRMLGELIARAGAGGAQILIETHSDHIINGIRLSVKDESIKKDEVLIAFFYKDEKDDFKHKYEKIDILKNGKLSAYPKAFFDEWENAMLELL